MPDFDTQAAVVIQPIPDVCMYLAAPPVAFPILASDMNLDPGTAVQGRYVEGGDGQLQGVWAPLLQDTYISGSSGRTGRAFTVISPAASTNTWKDDFNDPLHDRYGLLMPNSSAGVVWEVRSASITPLIEAADYIIKRGDPPAGDAGARVQTGYTCYVRFAYGSSDGTDYRVALEWGQPIRLDRTTDDGSTWYIGVAIARSLGNVERYMATHNGQVRLRVIPDEIRGIINIEIGDDGWLRHVSPTGSLPAPGNIDLAGQNGSVRFNYLPLRAQPLSVQGNVDPIGTQHPNADNAFLVSNALCSNVPDGQVDSLNVSSSDGQNFAIATNSTTPDAGDGNGPSTTPLLSDLDLIIPSVWVSSIDGTIDPIGYVELPNRTVDERQILDDASRTLTSSAVVNVDNQYGRFAGAYGYRDVSITAFSRGYFNPRFTGVAGIGLEGIDLSTTQALGRMLLPCRGHEFKMQWAGAQRRIYDDWCIFSAVRFECELGNIHPQFMQRIPVYVPPGATPDAPYGPAGDDCPYYVLWQGTGLRPRFDFGPEVSPWRALQTLVQLVGEYDPATGYSIPYYMGFQADRQFRFEVYDPSTLTPSISYSDYDATGVGQIIGDLHVYNSVAQMRSDVDFQGYDSLTYELLTAHLTLPSPVLNALGMRIPWFERNARYDDGYIETAIEIAAQIAARPQQVVKFKAPFNTWVTAGQKILVSERKSLGGTGEFVIIDMRSRYGMRSNLGNDGYRDSYSVITARSTTEYPQS